MSVEVHLVLFLCISIIQFGCGIRLIDSLAHDKAWQNTWSLSRICSLTSSLKPNQTFKRIRPSENHCSNPGLMMRSTWINVWTCCWHKPGTQTHQAMQMTSCSSVGDRKKHQQRNVALTNDEEDIDAAFQEHAQKTLEHVLHLWKSSSYKRQPNHKDRQNAQVQNAGLISLLQKFPRIHQQHEGFNKGMCGHNKGYY